jgi:tellurite resistance protein
MKKKTIKQSGEVSMDELAIMVQTGFNEAKTDLNEFRTEVNERFEAVGRRFDIVENKLIARHDKEIEQLRDKMLRIETILVKSGKL